VNTAYHLKELVWFRGWTPTHWLLIETVDGLKARCTYASHGQEGSKGEIHQGDQPVTDEMLTKIESAVPGSLAAIMGFDFLLCEGEPGSAVLNRRLNFPNCSSGAELSSAT
jgi:hypothetical protein